MEGHSFVHVHTHYVQQISIRNEEDEECKILQFFVMNMNYTTESENLEHMFWAETMHIIAVDEKKDYNLRIERKTVLRTLEVGFW